MSTPEGAAKYTRDTKIKNMMVDAKKKILTNSAVRDIDLRGTDFLPDIMMYQCLDWCLNKTDEELQQRREEMEERILQTALQKPEDILRLVNDRCMLTCLQMVLIMDEKKK